MLAVLLQASVLLLWGQPTQERACPSAEGSLEQLLTDGRSLYDKDDYRTASACFAVAAERAAAAGDGDAEARARLGLARTSLAVAAYARGAEEAQRARELFERHGDRLGVARADATLASASTLSGQRDAGVKRYQEVIRVFQDLGADADRASALVSYTLAADLSTDEEVKLLDEAIAIARALKLRAIEGRALHSRADQAFSQGLFDAAVRDLSAAIELFRAEDRFSNLADAYVSMGRIHRAHGQPDAAIGFYDQAAVIQQKIGDIRGLVQSTNAKAVALAAAGRQPESRLAYEQALEFARGTGTARLVNFQQGNLAAAYAASGDYTGAIRLLEDVIGRETDPYVLAYRHVALAVNYRIVHQLERALDHAHRGIKLTDQTANRDFLPSALMARAQVFRDLGRIDEALSDAQASTRVIEEIRARLVPLDFMKRGFSERNQEVFGLTIGLLHARGDVSASLVASEHARARAFLDLLASRSLVERRVAVTTVLPNAARDQNQSLTSFAAAAPASANDISHIAARLQSTIVSYWVDDEGLFVWVVAPDAPVRGVRVTVSRRDLEQTVTASLPTATATHLEAFHRLHSWLIQPVQQWLPGRGATLTIVPHGPLFQVSFAALRDGNGDYLVQKYAIGYSPSISAFMFTERLANNAQRLTPTYLVVADPRPLPRGADASGMAPLPASLHEAEGIRRTLGSAMSSLVLIGKRASEPLVRDAMRARRILHFATHAFVSNDEPFDSFLALGSSGTEPSEDGRLTVRELYDLELDAELVILSACSTATGRLSGDGITGLSRALFYAGAASIIATHWDVADEPSGRLMVLFHEKWRGQGDKRRALRDAQLQMIRELRAGALTVRAGQGTVRLREQPFNWAGYMLLGEP